MRVLAAATMILASVPVPASTQKAFRDLPSYCQEVVEVSSVTLLARTQGVQRSEAESLMQGMTDPAAIRMVNELIDFAYSRPANTSLETMKNELRALCLAKRIFAQ